MSTPEAVARMLMIIAA